MHSSDDPSIENGVEHRTGVDAAAIPGVLELLGRIGDALVATLGVDVEVVVHDLRHPERSIVAISGDLTGREVGAPISDPELLPDALDRFTEDDLRRRTTTVDGRELVSSTVWVREETGHIVGGLCINIDTSRLRAARDLIDGHLGEATAAPPMPGGQPLRTFAHNVPELIRLAVQETVARSPKPRHKLSPADRVALVGNLDAGGIFELRGSVEILADELGVSRASVYAYLKQARERAPAAPPEASPALELVLGALSGTRVQEGEG